MTKKKNPTSAFGANRVSDLVVATAKPLDTLEPNTLTFEIQSDLLAVRTVMRRFRVSYWHAKTICRLHGLGGYPA